MINKNGLLNNWLAIPVIVYIIFFTIAQNQTDEKFEILEEHDQYLLEQTNTMKQDIDILNQEMNTIYIDLSLLDQQNDTQINQIKRRIEDLKLSIGNIDSVEAMSHIEELWRELNIIRKVIGE